MVENIDSRFNFYIITSNKDSGGIVQKEGITINAWNKIGNAKVFYSSSSIKSIFNIINILKNSNYDIMYINGLFDPVYNLFPLVYGKLFKINQKVIIAPRGQLFSGALKLKNKIKSFYFIFIRVFKLYNNITFQATADDEIGSINTFFPKNYRILVAKNILTKISGEVKLSAKNKNKLFYFSRIDENKNLLFALKIISKISYPISFDIYGSIKNDLYWNECQKVIKNIPKVINVNYKGPFNYSDITSIIEKYGLMFCPTKGENFGHSIYETFANGLPVIISDKTPWINLKENKVGFDISLEKPQSFINAIEEHIALSDKDYIAKRKKIIDYIKNYYEDNNNINDTIKLFNKVTNYNNRKNQFLSK